MRVKIHPPGVRGQAPRLARADTCAENIYDQFFGALIKS